MFKNYNSKEKHLVFTADDFGMSVAFNNAVKEGFQRGFLTSACICANGQAFDHAIHEVIPTCPDLGLGVHLNIIEGKTLRDKISRTSALYNSDGTYRHGFLSLLANSSVEKLIKEIEIDFRIQIEKIIAYTDVDHINSHLHTHAVPPIFEIVCKLAKEYNIPYVRTQYEKFYTAPKFPRHLNTWYPINLVKIGILNACTNINKKTVKKYGLKTNDYLIGVGYTGHMDSKTIEYGLKKLEDANGITEILIHPCKFDEDITRIVSLGDKLARTVEFQTTMDRDLLEKIKYMGWNLTNFAELAR